MPCPFCSPCGFLAHCPAHFKTEPQRIGVTSQSTPLSRGPWPLIAGQPHTSNFKSSVGWSEERVPLCSLLIPSTHQGPGSASQCSQDGGDARSMQWQIFLLPNMILGFLSLLFFLVVMAATVCYQVPHGSLKRKPKLCIL